MFTVRRILGGLAPAAALVLAGLAAPAAHAATTASGDIWGVCNELESGEVQVIGSGPHAFIVECVYVPGLGGYYWIIYRQPPSCPAARPAGVC
jgi:hypothetical protein